MPKGYRHLTYEDRCQIYALKTRGDSIRSIAKQIGFSPSTASRGISRNSGGRGYRYKQAQGFAEERRRQASAVPRKTTAGRWAAVVDKLVSLQWSPERISGRLRIEGGFTVGPTWIYRHVWADREAGGSLYLNLRRRGKKRNRRGRDGSGRGVIPGRVDISERPPVVEEKSRVGDWEADTIIGGRHKGALVSLVDRCSKFTFLRQVPAKSADMAEAAVLHCLAPVAPLVHTITADNGKEFARHRAIGEALSAGFFFATPYHSWERGLNEHANGLARQYFPKSMDLRLVGPAEVRRVQDLPNNRPRRVLGFRTPAEVFQQALDAVDPARPSGRARPRRNGRKRGRSRCRRPRGSATSGPNPDIGAAVRTVRCLGTCRIFESDRLQPTETKGISVLRH